MMIAGLICFLAGYLSAAAGFDIETQGGSTSFTISMSGSDVGHTVYIAQSATCTPGNWMDDNDNGDPRVRYQWSGATSGVAPPSEVLDISCGMVDTDTNPESFENSHDPPIRSVGVMNALTDPTDDVCQDTSHCSSDDGTVDEWCIPRCRSLDGDYEISCGSACWVVDAGEEFGEAVGGIMAMMGLLAVMAILLGVGDLLLCIACCCCCQGPDKVPGGGGPVQGMVVGQPVGSA